MGQVSTTILTSDGQIKATGGTLVWLTISAGSTGGAVQINNSTDDSGTDVMSFDVPADSMTHVYLGMPDQGGLYCGTGIYCDIPGSNIIVSAGYK